MFHPLESPTPSLFEGNDMPSPEQEARIQEAIRLAEEEKNRIPKDEYRVLRIMAEEFPEAQLVLDNPDCLWMKTPRLEVLEIEGVEKEDMIVKDLLTYTLPKPSLIRSFKFLVSSLGGDDCRALLEAMPLREVLELFDPLQVYIQVLGVLDPAESAPGLFRVIKATNRDSVDIGLKFPLVLRLRSLVIHNFTSGFQELAAVDKFEDVYGRRRLSGLDAACAESTAALETKVEENLTIFLTFKTPRACDKVHNQVEG
ncbi:unnamed protein product [Cyclocybe aegerita]|uniref:Uncharacterized protein n=1 Tax=Cyclocybe aegerita TaxID=1973307 RepID=A0A8S0WWF0_CYCAE|nr:unnamed protein product [Cyclocybe aegerita]